MESGLFRDGIWKGWGDVVNGRGRKDFFFLLFGRRAGAARFS